MGLIPPTDIHILYYRYLRYYNMEQEIILNAPQKEDGWMVGWNLRWTLMLIMLMGSLLLSSCAKLKRDNPFAGNKYDGCMGMENVRFSFDGDSNAEATVTSVDFVGHFKDVLKGTYTCDSTMAVIHWTAVGEDNDVYKTVPLYEDTIILDTSRSTIMLHSQGKVHELKEYHFGGIREAYKNANGFGDILVTTVLCIILALFYAIEHWYITIPILIVVFVSLKYQSKRKRYGTRKHTK